MKSRMLAYSALLLATVAWVLPDPVKTPGDVVPGLTSTDVCRPGYAKAHRNVTDATKRAVCFAYGIKEGCPGPSWEIDHLISLTLGGSNDQKNLWPQPIDQALVKDKVEFHLHVATCAKPGRKAQLTLSEAQRLIAEWYNAQEVVKLKEIIKVEPNEKRVKQ